MEREVLVRVAPDSHFKVNTNAGCIKKDSLHFSL